MDKHYCTTGTYFRHSMSQIPCHSMLRTNIQVPQKKQQENLNASRSLIELSLYQRKQNGSNKFLPSRSAPSSTSPITSDPAVESSWYRESVLMPNALFTIPCVGLLLEEEKVRTLVSWQHLSYHITLWNTEHYRTLKSKLWEYILPVHHRLTQGN